MEDDVYSLATRFDPQACAHPEETPELSRVLCVICFGNKILAGARGASKLDQGKRNRIISQNRMGFLYQWSRTACGCTPVFSGTA